MPRAQGDPISKVLTTHVEEHERDALNEMLKDRGLTRYKYLRALVLEDLIKTEHLEPVGGGTVQDLWKGYRIKTRRLE